MKWWRLALCTMVSAAAVAGCGAESAPPKADPAPAPAAAAARVEEKVIRVRDEAGHTATFVLNGSPAADSLYGQLPLTVKVGDFSTNEKIFYPEALDLRDTPHPGGQVGALAYYAPWGNVVMFFDTYRVNGDLYELGMVVNGLEDIPQMNGMITIDAVE